MIPCQMSAHTNGEPFQIALMDEGSLTITSIVITIKKIPVLFKTTYNSKSNYPFYAEYKNCDYTVFDEEGQFDSEFLELCKTL